MTSSEASLLYNTHFGSNATSQFYPGTPVTAVIPPVLPSYHPSGARYPSYLSHNPLLKVRQQPAAALHFIRAMMFFGGLGSLAGVAQTGPRYYSSRKWVWSGGVLFGFQVSGVVWFVVGSGVGVGFVARLRFVTCLFREKNGFWFWFYKPLLPFTEAILPCLFPRPLVCQWSLVHFPCDKPIYGTQKEGSKPGLWLLITFVEMKMQRKRALRCKYCGWTKSVRS